MSKLAQLIAELCPNGVECTPVKQVVKIRNGRDYKHLAAGEVPVYGSGGKMAFVDQYLTEGPTVLIPRKGSLGNVFYEDGPVWTVDTIFYTEISDQLHPKFFYYLMLNADLASLNQAGGVPSLTQKVLGNLRIPIPPITIQNEIVDILDKFTELEAELEAELVRRKQQYEYFRERLLTFEPASAGGQTWTTLGSIAMKVSSGSTPRKGNNAYYDGGDIPWLRTQEVVFRDIWETAQFVTETALEETGIQWIPANCVIVALSGATAARSAINKIPLTTNQHCLNIEVDQQKAHYRFVFHWLSKNYLTLKAQGRGARSDLNSSQIKSFPFPLLPLERQVEIADVLDQFDALVNDLTSGLPAEIEARRKQYEYYRDKLLTFKELPASVAAEVGA